ncbi:MAG: DUF366 family protein [Bdellovibrionaceae bacterium]|nr:DUF366 family protein [Pseudobdellovibrionaceae bacterium]
MKTKFIKKVFPYTGAELRPHFAYENHGILGSSIVSWVGPCDIPFDHMVDLEDVLAQSPIRGGMMLHFIAEVFNQSLFSAVALQRLLASIVKDEIECRWRMSKKKGALRRDGDDVFWGDRKITISIASISAVSTQIHFAVNVNNKNTPVKTAALEDDFEINVNEFAQSILEAFRREFVSIDMATQKVKPLR